MEDIRNAILLHYQKALRLYDKHLVSLNKHQVFCSFLMQNLFYFHVFQQLKMEKLEAENKSQAWLLMALGLLVLLLLIGYWLLVMRKKNAEDQLYAAALEADNMRQTILNLESKTDVDPLVIIIDDLIFQLQSRSKSYYASAAVEQLCALDLAHVQALISHGRKLTTMDKRYILCFAAGMTVEDIADFMSLEPASVYTVRYRLKKKFCSEYLFPY